jgi:hypothetical protein
MNTPKKKSQRKRESILDDSEPTNIVYTQEEAEFLGYADMEPEDSELSEDDEDLDENEDLFEEDVPKVETPAQKKSRKKADKEKYYVNPLEFDTEIGNYYESGIMSDNLATMVSNIANKLSYAPNFINYTFREEMVGDGIIRMFKALTSKKYDHKKGATASAGPFSYFTRIAFNAFRNRIKKEKHMRDTHEKYQNELLMFSDNYNTITKNNQQRLSVNHNSY